MSMYEGSVRVPLVVSGPGFAKNSTISSLVSFERVNLEKLQVLKYILRLRDLKLYIFSFFDLVEKTPFQFNRRLSDNNECSKYSNRDCF